MNRFMITNIRQRTEMGNGFDSSAQLGWSPHMTKVEHHQSFEITLRPLDTDYAPQLMKKLNNVVEAGKTVTLQSTEYDDYVEPFKNEFIEFMMDNHPEKIIADTKSWERLLGRS